jgi:hypothetical protein
MIGSPQQSADRRWGTASRWFNRAPDVYDIYGSSVSEEHILEHPITGESVISPCLLRSCVDDLIEQELDATRFLHESISAEAGCDTGATWRATTLAKRVVYLSFPLVAVDPLQIDAFRRNGVNGRVHLLQGQSPENSIRLEAICTFKWREARIRYALAVQYVQDRRQRRWQVLRPLILVDPAILLAGLSSPTGGQLVLHSFRLLAILLSQSNHDYLHGTMMRWFPPPKIDCPPEYRSIMSEVSAPAAIRPWEARINGNLSGPILDGVFQPNADPLEHWSLIVHARTVARLGKIDPRREESFRALFEEQMATLQRVSAFFACLMTPRLISLQDVSPTSRDRRDLSEVMHYAREVHHGLVENIARYQWDDFYWCHNVVPIFEVLREYAREITRFYESTVGAASTGEPGLPIRT